MASQDRRKKHGQNTNKKRRRMRADVSQRKQRAAPPRPTHDEVDTITYKPGSGGDRTQNPAAKHASR
jgi:hypothetical protein